MKTANSHKNKSGHAAVSILVMFFCLILPFCVSAAMPEPDAGMLESAVRTSLSRQIPCKKMDVQIRPSKDKAGEIKILAVKLEGVPLGYLTADYVTVVYEKPVIDTDQLFKLRKFKIRSSSRMKVSILISAGTFENYLAAQARHLQVRNYRMSIKLSPPYVECFFNVPVSGLSPKSLAALDAFGKETGFSQIKTLMKAGRFEGYGAFQLTAKNNTLQVVPAKAIVNHFSIPGAILQEAQSRINPLGRLTALASFQYSINNVTVQNNYLFLSN